MFHTVIVEYIIHSDIHNYTKLAFNSLTIIQNDSFSANQKGDDPTEVRFQPQLDVRATGADKPTTATIMITSALLQAWLDR